MAWLWSTWADEVSALTAPRIRTALAACIACALLAGCGRDDPGTGERRGTAGNADASLPVPERTRGGVTGMPDLPGPGAIGSPGPQSAQLPPDTMVDSDGNIGPPGDLAVDPALADPFPGIAVARPGYEDQGSAGEPAAPDAATVIRDYYAAINSGGFGRAYSLWSDGGGASGQSPQQFADGFANSAGISVEIMPPGRIDAAAGSRYIEVPVTVTDTLRDGSTRRFVGAYTLRRAVADGATAEQRAWQITSADLRETRP